MEETLARPLHDGWRFADAPMPGNLLLAALPDQARLAPLLVRFELPLEGTLYELDEPITHYVFPTRGVLSLVKDMRGGTVEVGTVGREGMIGTGALLGVPGASTRIFAQADVVAYRIDVDDLDAVMEQSPDTRRLLMRYAHAFHEEVAQSVACNRLHSLEQRCAR